MKKKGILKQYKMLRTLVPTIAEKRNVSKLEVIEETVRYIEELQNRLIDSIGEEEAHHKMAETACFTLNNIVPDQDENCPLPSPSNQQPPASILQSEPPSSQGNVTAVTTVTASVIGAVTSRRRSSLNSNLRQ
jgi:hypothetical protein